MENLDMNILNLRKKCGYTQEKLAQLLGVSAGAVSKWECGQANPDIMLLKPLARTLKVSLEELLNFNIELTSEEIKQLKQKAIRIFVEQGYEGGESFVDDTLREYPTDNNLKISLSSALFMNLASLYEKGEEVIDKKLSKIEKLLEEVVKDSDEKIRRTGFYILAQIQLDRKEYDKCEKCMQELSSSTFDITPLYINLYLCQNKIDDMNKLVQRQLLDDLLKVTSSLQVLSKYGNSEHALQYLLDSDKLYQRFQFTYRTSQRNLAMYYIQNKQFQEASNAYLLYIKDIVTRPLNFDENPYFDTLSLEYNDCAQVHMRKQMLEMELQEKTLQDLQDYPAYQEAISLIHSYLSLNENV